MKRDFIAIADYTPTELRDMLELALLLKQERKTGGNKPILKGKSLGMIFQKPSLRTRVSFEMAMVHLGGYAFYLSPQEIGLGKRESIADVARVISGYTDGVMARVFAHQHVLELAKWSDVPIINGLSDYNHPAQGFTDAFTIYEHFGQVKGINVTFIGDGNNVAVSLMHIVAKLGGNFTWAGPEGYEIPEKAIAEAKKFAAESGSTLRFLHDPHEAVKGADVIYTDTWVSMGDEAEAERRKKAFPPYQVNQALVEEAQPEAVVMHCLPAHRGEEITDEVADGTHSLLFRQAHNRMHAQKAILARLLGGL